MKGKIIINFKKNIKYFCLVVVLLMLIYSLLPIAFAENKVETTEASKEPQYQRYVGFQDYNIPFKTRISESFKEGQTIHAVGKVSKDPKRHVC